MGAHGSAMAAGNEWLGILAFGPAGAASSAARQYHIKFFTPYNHTWRFSQSTEPPTLPWVLCHCALNAQACIRASPRLKSVHAPLPASKQLEFALLRSHRSQQGAVSAPGPTHARMRQPVPRCFGLCALILLPLALAIEDQLCFEGQQLVTLGVGQQTIQAATVDGNGACGRCRWDNLRCHCCMLGPLHSMH